MNPILCPSRPATGVVVNLAAYRADRLKPPPVPMSWHAPCTWCGQLAVDPICDRRDDDAGLVLAVSCSRCGHVAALPPAGRVRLVAAGDGPR